MIFNQIYLGTFSLYIQTIYIVSGSKYSKKSINNKVQKEIKNNSVSIITDKVESAISNLQKEPVFSSLYNIKHFIQYKQSIFMNYIYINC